MSFINDLINKAASNPKVVVLPEYGIDSSFVLDKAIDIVKDEKTAIPICLDNDMIMYSGKIKEFAGAYESRGDMTIGAKERLVKRPIAFASMMVKLGYANGLVCGRYMETSRMLNYVNAIIPEKKGQIGSSIYFNEDDGLVAYADMANNINPTAEELYKIIVTSAETFMTLTDISPTIGILSYVTGFPAQYQLMKDPEMQKVVDVMEMYEKGNHPWLLFLTQVDAAYNPEVAERKGLAVKEPMNLLIAPNLWIGNTNYKQVDRNSGSALILTQGYEYPADVLSRSDTPRHIANTIAACSVQSSDREINGFFIGE